MIWNEFRTSSSRSQGLGPVIRKNGLIPFEVWLDRSCQAPYPRGSVNFGVSAIPSASLCGGSWFSRRRNGVEMVGGLSATRADPEYTPWNVGCDRLAVTSLHFFCHHINYTPPHNRRWLYGIQPRGRIFFHPKVTGDERKKQNKTKPLQTIDPCR